MSPQGRRVRWWLVVGLCQVVLAYLAGQAFTHKTVVPLPTFSIPDDMRQYVFHGWPIIWSEYQQQGDHVGLNLLDSPPPRTDSGPIEFKGRNLVLPVLWFVLAVGLPPVVADLFFRRRDPDGVRLGPSVSIRLGRVAILGTFFGLAAAGLELETESHVFHVTGSGSWQLGAQFGPTYFLDRTINHYRTKPVRGTLPNGTPIYGPVEPWIAGSEWYKEVHSHLYRYRQELTGKPTFSASHGEWPRPEDIWRFRIRLTLASTGLGLLLGCLIFRPWRRAGGPSASDGAAATTPPSA